MCRSNEPEMHRRVTGGRHSSENVPCERLPAGRTATWAEDSTYLSPDLAQIVDGNFGLAVVTLYPQTSEDAQGIQRKKEGEELRINSELMARTDDQ